MAKFSNSSGSLYLNVYVDQGSQSITANTSTVNWRMTVSRTGAYYTHNKQGDSTLSLNLDGRNVHYSYPTWETSGEEYTLASGQVQSAIMRMGLKNSLFLVRSILTMACMGLSQYQLVSA